MMPAMGMGTPLRRDADRARRAFTVRGLVQGVGFRPHVHALASRYQLGGFVANRTGAVHIEVEGAPASLDAFADALVTEAPALARIDEIRSAAIAAAGDAEFCIKASDARRDGAIAIAPDVATCDDCLRELFDPRDRRHRYPFVNCARCGPRLTIVRGSPYDRERTTMAGFAMCATCRAEYDDPRDRRFHAQPVACPACGPRLRALDAKTRAELAGDALAVAVSALRAGQIGAVKGLGGYHLACDAKDDRACRELRARKHRDDKPFAILVRDLDAAERLAWISPRERELLVSPARPIVLLARRDDGGVAGAVAPDSALLGVMLPHAPLHHLLARDVGGPLVMTSGNVSDEPIAFDDDDALERLAPIADFALTHDRPIHASCDDSVVRVIAGVPTPVRRSRGYAPSALPLDFDVPRPTLAVGGQLKSTFALAHERRAVVSHHLGDLDHAEAYRAFVDAIAHYERLFEVSPVRVVHDAHPDYASTRLALDLAAERGLDRLAVQHHRAHVASVLADRGVDAPVIGVAFDGAGWGDDGAIWGGEIFVGDRRRLTRAAHLAYAPMPGGSRAMREPWRMAMAHLALAGADTAVVASRQSKEAARVVERLLAAPSASPLTSSVGRLFDAVASIAGGRDRVTYEGQAAAYLEALAASVPDDGAYPRASALSDAGLLVLDVRPLVRAAARDAQRGVAPARIARRFHTAMVAMVVDACELLRGHAGDVVLAGGCFVNALLAAECERDLAARGFRVHRARRVPSNDGGLCLGQLALAAEGG
jgi:hydrogenase maturation protein HypF